MKIHRRSGKYFFVSDDHISILGMEGLQNGAVWNIKDIHNRIKKIPPHIVSDEIERKITGIVEAGYGDLIDQVVISQRYAIYLFLQRYISAGRFRGAIEGWTNAEPHLIKFERGYFPFVRLRTVTFGNHVLPVLIVREKDISFDTVLIIDKDGKVL